MNTSTTTQQLNGGNNQASEVIIMVKSPVANVINANIIETPQANKVALVDKELESTILEATNRYNKKIK